MNEKLEIITVYPGDITGQLTTREALKMTEEEGLAEFNRIRDEYIDALTDIIRAERDQRYYLKGLQQYATKDQAKILEAEKELQESRENTDSLIRSMNFHLSNY